MKENPLVSIVIPTYNRANYISKCLNSVITQTYENIEIIIIDDASSDNTKEIVLQYNDRRIKYFRNEQNLGPSKSRNRGIENANGEIIAFQDSDDIWQPNKLEKQVGLLKDAGDDIAAVYCGMRLINHNDNKEIKCVLAEYNFIESFTIKGNLSTPSTQTVIIKRSVLEKVGYFDEKLHAGEDTELAIRVSKNGFRYKFIREPLVDVIRNHNSLMGNAQNYFFAYDYIYIKHNDYLHSNILFGFAKVLSNYWILKGNIINAKINIKRALKQRKNISTIIQLILIYLWPTLIVKIHKAKYPLGIPHPTAKDEFIEYGQKSKL